MGILSLEELSALYRKNNPVYKGEMQPIQDIFQIWPSTSTMAKAISAKADTVRKWKKHGRIPETSWQDVIDAAAVAGRLLTASEILAANAPMKQRGRPAHKVRPIRRRKSEWRAAR